VMHLRNLTMEPSKTAMSNGETVSYIDIHKHA